MDNYLMNLIFAANLLKYLFDELNWPWEHPYFCNFGEDTSKSRFESDVGEAVYTIWMRNLQDFYACYTELWKEGVHDKEAFSKYAVSAAASYFRNGYCPESFLGYCAIVLGVATSYYEFPPNGVPEKAVEVIALVLFAHQLTGQFYQHDGWLGLIKTSQEFNIVSQATFSEDREKQNRI